MKVQGGKMIIAAFMLAICVSAMAQEKAPAALPSENAPGDASFNAADQLAIITLFGAYAQSYDAGKLDEFMSLFADKVELKYMNGDNVVAERLDHVTRVMTGRVKVFAAEKIQRRHFLTTYAFASQTESEASGHLYVLLLSSKDGGAPTIVLMVPFPRKTGQSDL